MWREGREGKEEKGVGWSGMGARGRALWAGISWVFGILFEAGFWRSGRSKMSS